MYCRKNITIESSYKNQLSRKVKNPIERKLRVIKNAKNATIMVHFQGKDFHQVFKRLHKSRIYKCQ